MKKSFYITTTLPYVNAEPHIGFALELVEADVIARAKKFQGYDVFFNTGTDEHGVKVFNKAQEKGRITQEYVDEYAGKFRELIELLDIDKSVVHFVRTTDDHHKSAAQEIWRKCRDAGDIYKKNYTIKYCVGCELEKTDSELVDGHCPLHPERELEIRQEENYFFRFSRFQEPLLKLYKERPDFVIPSFRFNEIIKFVERGLEDFSISRLKEKMPWGVVVPDDDEHVMYVWFDALTNYISTIGWPTDLENYQKWWPVVQFAGKDQIRQQAAMWQAMLLSAGLTPSEQIIIHGFINFEGQKMSKSLGNFITPQEVIEKFDVDSLRYFVTREINQFEDTEVSWEKFYESYNANLANGIGNLTSRILKMAEANLERGVDTSAAYPIDENFLTALNNYEVKVAVDMIWEKIAQLDKEIQEKAPFKLVKTDKNAALEIITHLTLSLYTIALMLAPFMPQTSEKIAKAIEDNKLSSPLFLRKEVPSTPL